MHSCFEWDDSVAGHKYRLVQARTVIKRYVIKYREDAPREPLGHIDHKTIQELYGEKTADLTDNEGEYHPLSVIVQHESLFDAAVRELRQHIRSVASKLQDLLDRAGTSDDKVVELAMQQAKNLEKTIERLAA